MNNGYGYVYVLSNESMPGLVKIGKSINGGHRRAQDLFVTGVPSQFRVEFEIYVDDPSFLETAAHEHLGGYRVNGNREFFRCPVSDAILAILSEYASCHDSYVVHDFEFDAVEAARHLSLTTDHAPDDVFKSIRFVDADAISSAIEKKNAWIESRRERKDGAR